MNNSKYGAASHIKTLMYEKSPENYAYLKVEIL